jgi:beta-fructofuranosidase
MRSNQKKMILLLSTVSLFTLISCGKKQMDLKEHLVYQLSFDENEGGTTRENISKKNYNIDYVFQEALYSESSEAERRSGVKGNALLFDGYSTSVETDSPTGLSEDFSISLYLAPRAFETKTDSKPTVVFTNCSGTTGFELSIGNYGKWMFMLNTTHGYYKIPAGDVALDLYEWNHLVVVYSATEDALTLYKNNTQCVKYSLHGAKPIFSTSKLTIGKSLDPTLVDDVFEQSHYNGLLDEFEMYDVALTKDNIASLSIEKEIDSQTDLFSEEALLSTNRYCPSYHLRASFGWQNECYGMFYYEGKYHIFSQRNYNGPYYTNGQRWGHYVSIDRVHWTEVQSALVPEDNDIDKNDIFSGCSILDKKGRPVIFYTGVNYGSKKMNQISLARPSAGCDNNLLNWTKAGIVVVNQGDVSSDTDFRDPYVYVENGMYYMLVGGTNKQTGDGAIYSYRATNDDLTSWEYLGITYSESQKTYAFLGSCYELPSMYKVTTVDKTISKYVLMFSPIRGSGNGAYYVLGDFNFVTGKFTPESSEIDLLDYGPKDQVLCPSGFYDTQKDENVFFTMSRPGLTATDRYENNWASCTTLLKKMYLNEEGKLCFTPIEDYRLLEKETLATCENASLAEANQTLEKVHGDQLKIEIEFELNQDTQVGCLVKYDKTGIERLSITYDTINQVFTVDNSKSSSTLKNNGSGKANVEYSNNHVIFTIYVDKAMVESYLGDVCEITTFSYNNSKNATGIKLISDKSTSRIIRLKVTTLDSAYGVSTDSFWD